MPQMSRQPVVVGVKGKSCQCKLFSLLFYLIFAHFIFLLTEGISVMMQTGFKLLYDGQLTFPLSFGALKR